MVALALEALSGYVHHDLSELFIVAPEPRAQLVDLVSYTQDRELEVLVLLGGLLLDPLDERLGLGRLQGYLGRRGDAALVDVLRNQLQRPSLLPGLQQRRLLRTLDTLPGASLRDRRLGEDHHGLHYRPVHSEVPDASVVIRPLVPSQRIVGI